MVTTDLQGKTALILGGSSGLGLATAQKLASHGMRLIILYRAPRMMLEAVDREFQSLVNPSWHLTLNADATSNVKVPEIVNQIKEFLKE